MIKYGTGTFIVRADAQQDLFGTLQRIADIGFDGVELLGFFGHSPKEIRSRLTDMGMVAMGDHVPYKDFIENADRVIDEHLEAGCSYITIAHGKGDFTPGTDAFAAMLDGMRGIIEQCRKAGLKPQYHNHGWDAGGSPSYIESLADALDGLLLEPDLGWMQFAGAEPAHYLKKYAERCPVLHLKDIYCDDPRGPGADAEAGTERGGADKLHFEFRPTGYGIINLPLLFPLCMRCDPEWIITDHDLAYERDSYDDLRLSLEYTKALETIHRGGR